MTNYTLSEDQTLIVDTVRKFVQDSVEPKALERDEHGEFTKATFDGLAELGLLALPVAEDHGGAGMGMVAFVAVLEEIAGTCGSTARLMLDHAGLCGLGLGGVDAAGDLLGAVLMGEQMVGWVGRDAGISATASGDGVALTGNCPFVVAGAQADTLVVAAATAEGEELVLKVSADAVQRSAEPGLGFRAAGCGTVTFDQVAVGAEKILARGTAAVEALDRADCAGWLGGAAMAVGIARKAAEMAKKHAGERIAFGKPLLKQQAVAGKLVECHRATDAARQQVYHAAKLWDEGTVDRTACAVARLSAGYASVLAGDEAIQIHGGYGYTVEYHVERHYRDAQTLEVMDRGCRHLREQVAAAIA